MAEYCFVLFYFVCLIMDFRDEEAAAEKKPPQQQQQEETEKKLFCFYMIWDKSQWYACVVL